MFTINNSPSHESISLFDTVFLFPPWTLCVSGFA